MSSMKPEDIERQLRLFELVNDNVLPISALSAFLSIGIGIGIFTGATLTSYVAMIAVRRYIKSQKSNIQADLERMRTNGELSQEKYQELIAKLNKLTNPN